MKDKHIQLIIKTLMFIGIILVVVGVGLIIFTKLLNGTDGVLLISSLIAVGLFVVLPTKLYLVFQSLKKKDEESKVS